MIKIPEDPLGQLFVGLIITAILAAVVLPVIIYMLPPQPPYEPCHARVINGVNCVVCGATYHVDCDWGKGK